MWTVLIHRHYEQAKQITQDVHCVYTDQADEFVARTVTDLYALTNPVSDTNTQRAVGMVFVTCVSGLGAQRIDRHTLLLFIQVETAVQ